MTDVEKPAADKAKPIWRLAGALAANAVPLIGVAFWGWSAGLLLLLYWFENVAVGGFNAIRMVASGVSKGRIGAGALAFILPFYTFHYGLFCFVHGVFVWTMFGDGLSNLGSIDDLNGPFDLPRMVGMVMAGDQGMIAGVIAVLLWQGVLLAIFFMRREWRDTDPMTQMFAPYGRIITLHLTILAGGFVVMLLGQPWIGVLILALIKTAFDFFGDPMQKNIEKNKEQWEKARAELEAAFNKKRANPPPP